MLAELHRVTVNQNSVSERNSQARSIAALPAVRWTSAATALTGCHGPGLTGLNHGLCQWGTSEYFRKSLSHVLIPCVYQEQACAGGMLHYVALCCTMLHYVALCCTMLHSVALCCTMLHYVALCCTMLHYVALLNLNLHMFDNVNTVATLVRRCRIARDAARSRFCTCNLNPWKRGVSSEAKDFVRSLFDSWCADHAYPDPQCNQQDPEPVAGENGIDYAGVNTAI